jgi:hypothetical protein
MGSSVGRMVARKERRSHGQELTVVCTRGLRRFTTKLSGYLVEPQNQDRRLGRRRRDPGASRSFDAGVHVAGSRGLRWEDADCGEGVAAR